jgi:hypothetical protein
VLEGTRSELPIRNRRLSKLREDTVFAMETPLIQWSPGANKEAEDASESATDHYHYNPLKKLRLLSATWFCIPIPKTTSYGADHEPSDSIADRLLDASIDAIGRQGFDNARIRNFHRHYTGPAITTLHSGLTHSSNPDVSQNTPTPRRVPARHARMQAGAKAEFGDRAPPPAGYTGSSFAGSFTTAEWNSYSIARDNPTTPSKVSSTRALRGRDEGARTMPFSRGLCGVAATVGMACR